MNNEYYLFIKKEIAVHQAREEWEQCVQLCDRFSAIYPADQRTAEFSELCSVFNEKARYRKIMGHLRHLANSKGSDYRAARQIYAEYLAAHPGSLIAGPLKEEMLKLDALLQSFQIKCYRERLLNQLKNSDGRFVENNNEVFTDTITRLVWCLLDSREDAGNCMNYESSVQYVKNLKTGGYKDWRFPSVAELNVLYNKQPSFPSGETAWYWTSQSYARYDGEWYKLIDVLALQGGSDWQRDKKEMRECGVVRAVRP